MVSKKCCPSALLGVGFVGALSILPPSSFAQSAEDGSSAPDRRMIVQAQIDATYDSNVSRSSALLAAQRGITQSDVFYAPGLNIDFARRFGSLEATLAGTAAYDIYQTNTVLNRENLDFTAGAEQRFSRCNFDLGGKYDRRQSDLAYIVTATRGTEKNTTDSVVASAGGSCGKSSGLGLRPTFSVANTWFSNSNALYSSSDYDLLSASGGLAFVHPAAGSLAALIQYSKTSFSNSVGISNPTGGYEAWAEGFTYKKSIRSRLLIELSAFYSSLSPEHSSIGSGARLKDFNGLTYSGDLTYKPTYRITAHLKYGRSLKPSSLLLQAYEVSDEFNADLTYTMSRKLNFSLGASYLKDKYNGLTSSVTLLNGLESDDRYKLFVQSDFQFSRHFALRFKASHEKRDSNLDLFKYEDDLVSLAAISTF